MGRRENEQEVHRPEILAILLIQISRCLQIIKKCRSKHKRGKFTNTGTIGLRASCHASLATTSQKRWNSAYKSNWLHVGEQMHWFWRRSFRKCIRRNKLKKAMNWQLAIHIGSATTPNGWFWNGWCLMISQASLLTKSAWHLLGPWVRLAKQARWPSSVAPAGPEG